MTELHPALYDIKAGVASSITKRYRTYVTLDDVGQECLLWALGRNEQFSQWLNEPDAELRSINEKRIAWQMRRVAERYARKEKAAKSGYQTGDEAFYDTATIAQLLPFVVSSIINDVALEAAQVIVNDGQPRKPSAPAEGGNLLNTLMDIKRAYEKLSDEERQILLMRYYQDCTLQQIAEYEECAISTADRRCTSALRKLVSILGGESPWN